MKSLTAIQLPMLINSPVPAEPVRMASPSVPESYNLLLFESLHYYRFSEIRV